MIRSPAVWLLVTSVGYGAVSAQAPAAEVVVTGRIVDEIGRPVRGATVGGLQNEDDIGTLLARPQATTADDGSYRLALAGGRLLTAIAPGRQVCTAMVWSPGPPVVVDLTLMPGSVLEGLVTDTAGAPLVGARVSAEEAVPHLGVVRQRSVALMHTDADGRFRLPGVATTGLRVTVSFAGCYTETAFVHAGEPCHLRVPRSGFVRGRVVGADGTPVSGVALHTGGGGEALVVSDAEGRFAVDVWRRGSFRVFGYTTKPQAHFRSRVLTGPTDDVAVVAWGSPAATVGAQPVPEPITATAEVSSERWLDVVWSGGRPDGGPALVSAHATTPVAGTQPLPRLLGAEPSMRLGPVAQGAYAISVWRRSRARLNAGSRFELGIVDGEGGELSLAGTAMVLQRGRVELVAGVPPARIGVIAHWRPAGTQRGTRPLHHAQVAGLDRDAGFALDLPPGRWLLQLFDVATGAVFHTAQPHEVAAGGPPVVLVPAVHVLEYELATAAAGDELACDWLAIALHGTPAPGWAVVRPNLDVTPSSFEPPATLHSPGRRGICLVPRGCLSIAAYRELESDEPTRRRTAYVGGENVDVKDPVHRVRIEIRDDR